MQCLTRIHIVFDAGRRDSCRCYRLHRFKYSMKQPSWLWWLYDGDYVPILWDLGEATPTNNPYAPMLQCKDKTLHTKVEHEDINCINYICQRIYKKTSPTKKISLLLSLCMHIYTYISDFTPLIAHRILCKPLFETKSDCWVAWFSITAVRCRVTLRLDLP